MTMSRTFRPRVQRGAAASGFSGADAAGPAPCAVPRRLSQRSAGAQIASGAGDRFALAGAKCERRLPARYGPAPEVLVEQRGSGGRPRREEIHHFGIDGPNGFGHRRVSPSREGGSDALAEVRTGDAVTVPQCRICFHPAPTEGYR
jgi:hypothetical protein